MSDPIALRYANLPFVAEAVREARADERARVLREATDGARRAWLCVVCGATAREPHLIHDDELDRHVPCPGNPDGAYYVEVVPLAFLASLLAPEEEGGDNSGADVGSVLTDSPQGVDTARAPVREETGGAGVRWTDDEGAEAVLLDGRLSIFAEPSLTYHDGETGEPTGRVAVGIDVPDAIRARLPAPPSSVGDGGEPEPEGLRVARRSAGWYLGDPAWADKLIGAYLQPKETAAFLDYEMGEDEPAPTGSEVPR